MPFPRSTMKTGLGDLSWSALADNIVAMMTLRSRFGRFVAVGCVNAAFGYSIFTITYLATHNDDVAVVVNWLLGIAFNFFSTGRLVFSNRSFERLIPFVASYLLSMIVNLVLINVLVSLGVNALLAQALCLPVVVVFSYLINSRFVFRRRPQSPSGCH